MPDVFVSHSATGKEFARKLATDLSQQGLSVWLDETSLRPGDNWAASIQEAISNSKSFVAVVSRDRDSSPWFNTELAIALASSQNDRPKKIIPVVADNGTPLPPFLRQFQAVDMSSNQKYASRIADLIRATKEPANERSTPSPEVLRQYGNLLPDSAERLLEMAESMTAHRRSLESKANYRNILLPALIATLVSVVLIIVFVAFGSNSLDRAVSVSLGLVSGILANSAFHTVREYWKSREREGHE